MRKKMIGDYWLTRIGVFESKEISLLIARRWVEEMGGSFVVEDNNQGLWEIWITNYYDE